MIENTAAKAIFTAALICCTCVPRIAIAETSETLEQRVKILANQLMNERQIPGMAVGIIDNGAQHQFYYGLANVENKLPVTSRTLFELGSISKTFTATLGSYAAEKGAISLSDKAHQVMPALQGSSIGESSLLNLATYTAGGLPLQFPEHIQNEDDMDKYFALWRPAHSPGTYRQYSNPSIGLFGNLVAKGLNRPFETLMEQTLLPSLSLQNTFINVPIDVMQDYAFGYKNSSPVRVSPGLFDAEAYGIKSYLPDMLRFLKVNISPATLPPPFDNAIRNTHKGRYAVGPMVQCLGWELFPYPTSLETLLAGNSANIIFKPNVATEVTSATDTPTYINKTGSTNGFGAYVAFIPHKKVGVVLLANKNFPIPDRIRAAYTILSFMDTELNSATDN